VLAGHSITSPPWSSDTPLHAKESSWKPQFYLSLLIAVLLLDGCHLGELADHGSDWVVITHVVDVEASDRDVPVQLADQLHVLELVDHRVLEALLEHIVVSLLHGERTLRFLFRDIKRSDQGGSILLSNLLKLLAVRFLLPDVSITLDDAPGKLALKVLEIHGDLLLLLAKLFGVATLDTLLLDFNLLPELHDVLLDFLELLGAIGLRRDLVGVVVALVALKVAVETLKVNRVFDDHFLKGRLLLVLLTILALHVFEEAARADSDFNDFAGGQVDTPA